MKKEAHFDTKAIHAGGESDQHQSLSEPLYMGSTFTFKDLQQADDTFSFKRKAYVYTRGGNPTVNLFERRMAILEHGVAAVAFASGMAAITSTLLAFVTKGDTVLAHRNLYGSSYSALTTVFSKFGIKTALVNMTDLAAVKNNITSKTKVIYFETPTNPSLEIIDIAAVTALAKEHGIKVVIDNTFATPYWQNPLDFGADVVVHSATKYIGGHGDALGGIAIASNEEFIHQLKFGYMCELGGVMSPFNAWLLLRGLKTLGLRMERHAVNARAVANFLADHPKVTKVMYPGFKSHPNHAIAAKQMSSFGGIVTFELEGGLEEAKKCVESMELAKLAVSLGDAETLVEIPALMTHRAYLEKDLAAFGFSKKTIRIAIGLEKDEDIIADIVKALN